MREHVAAASPPSFWSRWVSPFLALLVVVLAIRSRTHDSLTLLLVCFVVASALSAIAPVRARPRVAKLLSALGLTACLLFLAGFLIRHGGAIL